jgi:hypothetical protein
VLSEACGGKRSGTENVAIAHVVIGLSRLAYPPRDANRASIIAASVAADDNCSHGLSNFAPNSDALIVAIAFGDHCLLVERGDGAFTHSIEEARGHSPERCLGVVGTFPSSRRC